MSKPVMVRVLKEFGRDWNFFRVGQVVELEPGYRRMMLDRGNVELVEAKVETAALTTKKRKRKRKTRAKVQ